MNMPKMIQIRNVPEELHREIKVRAAKEAKTMSQFLLEMAQAKLRRPDIEAFMQRVRSRPIDTSGFDATAFIRRQRDSG